MLSKSAILYDGDKRLKCPVCPSVMVFNAQIICWNTLPDILRLEHS